jgi:hypothetical protein
LNIKGPGSGWTEIDWIPDLIKKLHLVLPDDFMSLKNLTGVKLTAKRQSIIISPEITPEGWGKENYPYPSGAAFIECDEMKCQDRSYFNKITDLLFKSLRIS